MIADISEFVSGIWQNKPAVIIVAVGGVIIFALLVIDTHRHRKKKKGRHSKLH